MRFEILKSADNQFYFNIVSDNNQVVATSEMYTQKKSAVQTITSIIRYFTVELDTYQLDRMEVEDLIVDKTKGES